jgi:hypothetical protein
VPVSVTYSGFELRGRVPLSRCGRSTNDSHAEPVPHYGPRARLEGRRYFDLVMRPETFTDASALTRCIQIPG